MISTIFETEKYDYVTIDDTKYSGSTAIDTILSTNFTVVFQSDESETDNGFVLNWNCLSQWNEWTPLGDGTCKDAIGTQPPYNGSDLEYQTKYRKSNETCSTLTQFMVRPHFYFIV